ncbi:MAG: hypothetical protein WC375_08655, partial [Methanomassiliicoccales archaeon]
KALENGKWVDKSNGDRYNIYWELEEQELFTHTASKDTSKEKVEEVQDLSQNNEPDINDSFEITEK